MHRERQFFHDGGEKARGERSAGHRVRLPTDGHGLRHWDDVDVGTAVRADVDAVEDCDPRTRGVELHLIGSEYERSGFLDGMPDEPQVPWLSKVETDWSAVAQLQCC